VLSMESRDRWFIHRPSESKSSTELAGRPVETARNNAMATWRPGEDLLVREAVRDAVPSQSSVRKRPDLLSNLTVAGTGC
jgi:hypothetical protein